MDQDKPKPIKFKCPYCHKSLKSFANKIGRISDCPGCNEPLAVPDPLDKPELTIHNLPADQQEVNFANFHLSGDLRGPRHNEEQQMWYHHPITIIAAFIIFWPVGLGLLLTHPKIRGSWKMIGGTVAISMFAILSLGCFMACLGVGSPSSPNPFSDPEVKDAFNRAMVREIDAHHSQQSTTENPKPKIIAKDPKTNRFQTKVDAWKHEQIKINSAISELSNERQELIVTMRRAGKDGPLTRTYAEEILELDGQASFLHQKTKTYNVAIGKADSALRRIERRKMLEDAGVSESELDDLAKTVYELDDSLKKMSNNTATIELDVDDILKEVFER